MRKQNCGQLSSFCTTCACFWLLLALPKRSGIIIITVKNTMYWWRADNNKRSVRVCSLYAFDSCFWCLLIFRMTTWGRTCAYISNTPHTHNFLRLIYFKNKSVRYQFILMLYRHIHYPLNSKHYWSDYDQHICSFQIPIICLFDTMQKNRINKVHSEIKKNKKTCVLSYQVRIKFLIDTTVDIS